LTQRKRQRRRRGRRRGLAGRTSAGLFVLFVLAVGAGIGGLSGVGWVVAIAATTPPIEELVPQDKGRSSQIFAADGSLLGYVVSDEIRAPVPADQHPRDLRNATVAIEDERFWNHEGVDFEGIVRAGLANLESGRTVQGGSTITQQLVRALYIKDPERNVQRKIREAKLASDMEARRSKQWILKEYLNSVPYGTVNGRTAVGVEAAAETYFAKHAKDLDLAESALLSGLPQAPSQYNPFRNPEAAITRRNQVLQQMIDTCVKRCPSFRRRARRAMVQDMRLRRGNRYTKRREPHFFDYVQEQLIEEYGVSVYRRGGLKIHTTIDPKLQKAGREAIANQLGYPDDPSSAVVAIDPQTGYIRAMTSSGTYDERTFNLAAQGKRQPGSAFKTMVLTTALRRGVDPRSTYYTSKKLDLDLPGTAENYEVQTYDGSYGGRMDLVKATLKSDNTVYAQLDVDLGPERVAETARLMGITSKLDGFPAEGLGGLRLGVSPLEMANAYATLAAGGMRSRPKAIRRVDFPDGKSDELGKPRRKRVFSDGVAAEVTKVLEKNVEAGTGKKADIGCPAAGKTGTTDNFNDAWFVGYTPKLAASVWVGYPNAQREMRGVHGVDVAGGTIPASIWGAFMGRATGGGGCGSFKSPENPVQFTPFYGRYASGGAPAPDPTSQEAQSTEQYGTGTGGAGTPYTPPPATPTPQPSPPEADSETDTGGADDGVPGE
jgi:penicillin-binding protein 1A